jgi:hypothetical protein
MKRFLLYILPIGLVALLLVYFGFFNSDTPQQKNGEPAEQSANTEQWETKTDDQSPVTVKITPMELGKGVDTWKFNVAFDTHAGRLDDEPVKVISLSDDRGNTYQPISWEGAAPGGHHREGDLVFNAIVPAPLYIELKVKNVGGIPERLFRWNLE